ncbi:MAG: hypothetical protein EF807_08015 [Candidatus Methanolliviera hydrocarbonicum]|uniref:Uncharacterized protein n=1 Tax=Candidatus Methanolliviera hydrocarbonicum TaxID=2491085 RepID=A0A520KUR3_9EURY|nr:MAG: hypothetical protein EF807_08015 [Candidatus Methanolliviera hydrocarbonicum]
MMSYTLLSKKPKIFRTHKNRRFLVPQIEDLSAFTGLSIEEFNRLYPMIADRYGDYEKKRVVEHVIGRRKKFKIMGSEFRNKLERYDAIDE